MWAAAAKNYLPIWAVFSIVEDLTNEVQILVFLVSPGRSAVLLDGRFSGRISNRVSG